MNDTLARRFWLAAFILLCCAGPLHEAWKVRHWGNALSSVDFGADANALREVDGFRAEGIWHDYGLGNVLFGPRYPDAGLAPFGRRFADGSYAYPSPYLVEWLKHESAAEIAEELSHQLRPSGVYTHYPPGPEYLLYLDEAVLGPEPVSRLRLLPIAIGAAATVFYGLSLRRRFGSTVAWSVILASLTVASFSNAYTSLSLYGYALALLLVEIGVAIGLNSLRWPFLVLGFLQGWLSFDYFFLVTLAPLAVEASLPVIEPRYDARWRLAVERCFLAGFGFGLAHLLHLSQVWAYYGSLSQAIGDLQDSARYRAVGEQNLENGWSGTVIANLNHHLFLGHPFNSAKFLVFGLPLGALWILIALVFLAVGIARFRNGPGAFNLLERWALMGAIGVVASCAWHVVMAAHAHFHYAFNYRHLILCFELWAIFLAVQAATPIERWLTGSPFAVVMGPRSVGALLGRAAAQLTR